MIRRSLNNWRHSVIIRYGGQIGICGFELWTTIADVAEMVADTTGLVAEQQRLIFAGTGLDHYRTLASYGITDGSTLLQEALHWSCGNINLQVKIVFVPLVPRVERVVGPFRTLRCVHPHPHDGLGREGDRSQYEITLRTINGFSEMASTSSRTTARWPTMA